MLGAPPAAALSPRRADRDLPAHNFKRYIPECVRHAHHLLLVLGVLDVRVGEVNDRAFDGVALVARFFHPCVPCCKTLRCPRRATAADTRTSSQSGTYSAPGAASPPSAPSAPSWPPGPAPPAHPAIDFSSNPRSVSTHSKLLALCMEESRLGVEMSAETPSSTGVAGDAAASTSLPDDPILPKLNHKVNIDAFFAISVNYQTAYPMVYRREDELNTLGVEKKEIRREFDEVVGCDSVLVSMPQPLPQRQQMARASYLLQSGHFLQLPLRGEMLL
ncbi:hypothetical protein HW555_000404 [Spodoptera exigua]|uniref:Uncharacterized protein n=1 Tax=Spodoptera exigua TaxID=7107 RepID=A0A835GV78_SPOEX|nr:hypothetical protein HW555_000404 [Spodoptera exigua]